MVVVIFVGVVGGIGYFSLGGGEGVFCRSDGVDVNGDEFCIYWSDARVMVVWCWRGGSNGFFLVKVVVLRVMVFFV